MISLEPHTRRLWVHIKCKNQYHRRRIARNTNYHIRKESDGIHYKIT